MLRFECELDDPGSTSVLGDSAEPRTLMIWDNDQQRFEKYAVADLELDADAGELRIGVDCKLPHQISDFPRWIRHRLRESWRLRTQSPIVTWEHVNRGEALNSTERQMDKVIQWLFAGRSKHDST